MRIFFMAMLLSLGFLFGGCTPPSGIDKEFDKTGETLRVKVITHDTIRELHAAKFAIDGETAPVGLIGFAGWNSTGYCEVHIVEPKRDLDDNVMTLGHEMMHCIYGSFHK